VQPLRRQAQQATAGASVLGAFTFDEILIMIGQEMLIGTAPLVPLIAIRSLLTTEGIYGVLAFAIARRSRGSSRSVWRSARCRATSCGW
jgi:hypothetical protein